MTEREFRVLAIQAVKDYHNKSKAPYAISSDDISIVWQCRALQNYKATLTVVPPNGMYYEATYNGDKNELYLDVYKKVDNICLSPYEFKVGDKVKCTELTYSEMSKLGWDSPLDMVGTVTKRVGGLILVDWPDGASGAYFNTDLVLAEDSND